MAKLLKLRRGTTAQHSSFTGAEGEVTVDTDKESLVVHNGSNAGGYPIAREDMSNVSSASITGRLGAGSIAAAKIADNSITATQLATNCVNNDELGGNAVTAVNITDGIIANAKIAANAAIAGTKISPNFGSQDVSIPSDSNKFLAGASEEMQVFHDGTSSIVKDTRDNGKVRIQADTFDVIDKDSSTTILEASASAITSFKNHNFSAGIDVTGQITSTGALTITNEAPAIALVDSGQNPDWEVINNNGTFVIKDSTNNASKFYIESDGSTNIVGNLDAEAGVDVTGNITVTGTVDGVDVAALNTAAARKDGTNMGATTFRVDGSDFVVQDNDDSVTNYIWRDHSHDTLYLGTANAVITPRSHVIPGADSTYNIGSSSVRFANGYFDTLYGDGSNLTGVQPFPSGTKMLFQQTAAPTGWTKVTSAVDNKALRLVSGTVGSGGNSAFTTAFASYTPSGNVSVGTSGSSTASFSGNATSSDSSASFSANATTGNSTASFSGSVSGNTGNAGASTSSEASGGTVNNHTLSTAQMPSHSHSFTRRRPDSYASFGGTATNNDANSASNGNTHNTGGGGSHSHGFSGANHSHNVNNHTHSFSGNVSGNTGNHTHSVSVSGNTGNHSHTVSISGNTGNHTHSGGSGSFSGSARDFAVQYIDVIVASKD